MTAAVKMEPTATIERKQILISLLDDSPLNPRKTFDKARLEELGASMRAMGQLQPILVRPSKKKPGRYEIASGHRRRRGGEIAGLVSLEAIVRELSDEEIIVIGLTEDQNEPLPPLEEAAGYKALKDLGWTVERIADKAGKSLAIVRKRLRLTHLHEDVQGAVRAGWLLPGAAALFARLESLDEQLAVLSDLGGREGGIVDAGDVDYAIHARMRKLSDAPFDVKDIALVAKAGACGTCPKRTFAQAKLFDEEPDVDDRCTDGPCWNAKTEANTLIVIEKSKAKGQRVVDDKEAKKEKIVNEHGRLDYAYVPLDEEKYDDHGKATTTAKILEKAGVKIDPVTVVVQGVAKQVIPRKAFEKAQKSSASDSGPGPNAKFREESESAKKRIDEMRRLVVNEAVAVDAVSLRAAFILSLEHAVFESVRRAITVRGLGEGTHQPLTGKLLIQHGDYRRFNAIDWLRLLVEVHFPHSNISAEPQAKDAVKLFPPVTPKAATRAKPKAAKKAPTKKAKKNGGRRR